MKKLIFEDSFEWNGEIVIQNWYSTDDFDNRVYGRTRLYILKDNQLLLVQKKDNTFQIPGGGIEGDETPIDAALREVEEEVNATANAAYLVPICIQESYQASDEEKKTYEIHYCINASNVDFKDFKFDPAGKIIGNQFVELTKIDDFLKWGKKAHFLGHFLSSFTK